MKKNLHPERVECTITCACGNSFKTISNKPLSLCSMCRNKMNCINGMYCTKREQYVEYLAIKECESYQD